MSWSGIASNQCVSLDNLRDAIANNIFIAKTTVPAGTKQITKTEALAYVDIQTAPLASKASNQLVVKNNLNAAVYTYQRYDVNTTNCNTSNPIPHWSYYDIPFGLYNINGTGSLYQLLAATHTTFTNQITSYNTASCTPVTQYTYVTYDVNVTTCSVSNPIQWWSYNNYSNGYYYINGPGTLYELSASTHTNYTNQITSAVSGTCSGTTIYYYDVFATRECDCAYLFIGRISSNEDYGDFSYYMGTFGSYPYDKYGLGKTTNTTGLISYSLNSISSCEDNPCKIWFFWNRDLFNLGTSENFTFIDCFGTTRTINVAAKTQVYYCVKPGTTPGQGSKGDYPYTFDDFCCQEY
jgi:hypothetical protein